MSLIALHYELKEEIGRGAFGRIFRVEDIATKKIFAIKIFDKIPLEDIREKMNPKIMRQITKFSHPNLIKIFDYGIYQNNLYLISEYYTSRKLHRFRLTKKNKKDFFQIITQVCYALDHLHSHNIIHKDLKLDNVLYQKHEEGIHVKVCDYGFNKIISQTEAYPESEVISLPYIAPELLQGSYFSKKSDFYALGVMMYYLTVGTFPFSREEIKLMSEKKIPNIIPQFPSKINPAVDKKLEDLIFHLIEFNPDLRINKTTEIIKYINEMQKEVFPLSMEPPLVEQIKTKQLYFHDSDIDSLRGQINEIKNKTGQIVFVTGEKGVGKTSLLQYIKWFLLSENYHVFYYNCNDNHRDPFFMLCKEIFISQGEKGKHIFQQGASQKLCEFMFKSEEQSLKIVENEMDLRNDFDITRDYIYCFASTKPIVYFITNIEKADESTIHFLNFLARDVQQHPLVLVISTFNPFIADQVNMAKRIHIAPLNRNECYSFLKEIFGSDCPITFMEKIFAITNGNQRFILYFITHLIQEKVIIDKKNEWYFDANIFQVDLPLNIRNAIDEKIKLIPQDIKKLLVKLSLLKVPLSIEIIRFMLDLKDSKELFFFIENVEKLDVLVKNEDYIEDGYYKFVYPALKAKLAENTSQSQKISISKRVIEYFSDKEVTKPPIIRGIIWHCEQVKDSSSLIDYYLKLIHSYLRQKSLIESWNACYEGFLQLKELQNDIETKLVQTYLKRMLELAIILKKCDIKGVFCEKYSDVLKTDGELLLLHARFLVICRKFKLAEEELAFLKESSFKINKNDILLAELELYNYSLQAARSKKVYKELKKAKLNNIQTINFNLFAGDYYYSQGKYEKAVSVLLKASQIAQLESKFARLGRIYKVLGDSYNIMNEVEQAIKYYEKGTAISMREGDILNVANILSHWGYLNIKQGRLHMGLDRSNEALDFFKQINFASGMAEVHLNLAQIRFKLGNFRSAEKHFDTALEIAQELNYTQMMNKINSRASFLKLRIYTPKKFLDFLKTQYTEFFINHKIGIINSYLKNYCFWLVITGNDEELKEVYQRIEEQKVDTSLEKEFIHQLKGWIERSQGNFSEAIRHFEKALAYAKRNQNDYAQMLAYFNIADTYYKENNTKQAEINCDQARALADDNSFSRWINYARVLEAKFLLKKANANLRPIIRKLLKAETEAKHMKDWYLRCESLLLISLIYRILHLKRLEYKFRTRFNRKLNVILRGLSDKDQERLKKSFNVDALSSQSAIRKIIEPRINVSPTKLQHYFFDLLNLSSVNQIRFYLKKYIKEVIGIDKFGIVLYENKESARDFWVSSKFKENELSSKHQKYFDILRTELIPQYYTINNQHFCLVPLTLKNELEGFVILSDWGEYPFTKSEKLIIKLSGFYLTIILKKVGEYEEVYQQREQLSNLITISRDILQIMDIEFLMNQITLNAIKLSGAKRGFFISLDENKNFVFNVALLETGEKIDKNNLKISKTVLKDVYETKVAVSTIDAFGEPRFTNSESIHRHNLHSIFCAPLNVHNEVFGFIYLDNMGAQNKTIRFNSKLLEIFILMAETAIKNSLDYEKLSIANQELLKLDQERAQFMNMSSHEFNTPIQTLRGYLEILKDKDTPEKVRNNTIKIMEKNIDRLLFAINNIMQMNALDSKGGITFDQESLSIKDILKIVYEETLVFAEKRKQKLTLSIADGLKSVSAESITLINAIKNLVLNAIKFTEDYGEITIGARKSRYRKEEINNKESVVIFVKDNGIGIPSYELDNIFKEFYEVADIKAHHSGLTEFKSSGLGLGLPITKTIIELYGGKMWVKSVKGEGSTFFIALPFAQRQRSRKGDRSNG